MRSRTKTLRAKWIGFLAPFIAIILIILIATMISMNYSLRQQAARNSQNILTYYKNQLHQEMRTEEQTFSRFCEDEYLSSAIRETDPNKQYFVKRELEQHMLSFLHSGVGLDGVWMIAPKSKGIDQFIVSENFKSLDEKENLLSYIKSLEYGMTGSDWAFHKIGNEYFLMKIITKGNYSCGVWIMARSLLATLKSFQPETGIEFLICDKYGNVLEQESGAQQIQVVPDESSATYHQINGSSYIQAAVASAEGGFMIAALVSQTAALRGFTMVVPAFLIIFLNVAMIFLLSIYFISLYINDPLWKLVRHISVVREGDLKSHINEETGIYEFQEVYRNFNDMQDNILRLEQENRDERLEEEHVKRQFLQMQLKSHFFLNCININYSLIGMRRYDLAKKLDICMGKYMRYISRDVDETVLVKDEVEHIQDYMSIQELRYPDKFTYSIYMEPNTRSAKIYPLMIQTFVENAGKYAIIPEHCNIIQIIIAKEDKSLRITVRDNGNGFPQDLLRELNQPSEEVLHGIQGVGIRNVKARLRLYYHGKAHLSFSNAQNGGADVELLIPWYMCKPSDDKEPKVFQ